MILLYDCCWTTQPTRLEGFQDPAQKLRSNALPKAPFCELVCTGPGRAGGLKALSSLLMIPDKLFKVRETSLLPCRRVERAMTG